jgi:formamidopyrimidine-DNA glycosylase
VPELPEVEVMVRHLGRLLTDKVIRTVEVHRAKAIAPASARSFAHVLRGARFAGVSRRGKYLLFDLRLAQQAESRTLIGHLGMAGRMYLLPLNGPLPKHAVVVLGLGRESFVFEDPRHFGRLTLDPSALERLGPEPLEEEVAPETFVQALNRSRQPVKVKLLDQSVVAGVGNIYASEALFRARISPMARACQLRRPEVERLWQAIRETLAEAVECGSTVPLNFSGAGKRDGLFYFGGASGTPDYYAERLRVYDRANQPCLSCGATIRRVVQAARSTYYCVRCQRAPGAISGVARGMGKLKRLRKPGSGAVPARNQRSARKSD